MKRKKRQHRGAKREKKELPKGVSLLNRKQILRSGLLMEAKIWSIKDMVKYPIGVRYRLVLVDPNSGQVKLLMDNHWPKGPHIHVRSKERDYIFESVEKLVEEFYRLCDEIEEKQ